MIRLQGELFTMICNSVDMLVAVGLVVFLAVAIWYYQWYRLTSGLKEIKGPRPWPIFGNGLEFFGDSTVYLSKPYEFIKKYGDVVKLMLGYKLMIVSRDYKMMEFILSSNKHIDKGNIYNFLHRWLGTGLLTSTGEKWRKRRKIITPAYHFQILEQFTDIFDANSNILVAKLEKEVDKGSTDIYPYVTLCTLDNICESAMGTSVNAQQREDSPYVLSVKELCRIITERTISVFQQYDLLYYFSSNYRQEKKGLKVLHNYTTSVIVSRRNALLKEKPDEKSSNDIGKKKRVAFLDLLLKSTIDGKPLSNDDIREEVDTFMFEGHDTTASAITFALYCIANNPRVQEKILAEQRELFGEDPDRLPSHRDLQDMKYLELALKEALRLYPSVPYFVRELQDDYKYSEEITFKKGTQITIFAFALLRDEKYFPNPDEFIPERFEEGLGKFPYAYVPFSAGPRNCIGQKFAMLEMKSVVSKVLRKYELHQVVPEHKLQLVPETILKSANGVLVSIKKRQW